MPTFNNIIIRKIIIKKAFIKIRKCRIIIKIKMITVAIPINNKLNHY